MKKVAIITSGGDGSGINSAINTISKNSMIELYGFNGGYEGVLNSNPIKLTQNYCENYSLDGRLLIHTGRSKLTYTKEGRAQIISRLEEFGFEYLIICGGNGSLKAANLLNNEGLKTLFIPMTIDNDVNGSEYSVGHDSALNRIINVIHDLQDTAFNMPGRIFMIEVMGGNCGHLGLAAGIAGGCDIVIIPEYSTDKKRIVDLVKKKLESKKSIIIICSETAYEEKNNKLGNQGVSLKIGQYIESEISIRVRQSILGFYIRAGNTSFLDGFISAKMGYKVCECIENDISGFMIGVRGGEVDLIDLNEIEDKDKALDGIIVDYAINNNMIILD